MDSRAEADFQRLLDEIRRNVVNSHFREMTRSMQAMSGAEMAELREMAADLNRLLRQKLDGASEPELQRGYERFRERWGRMFPNAPERFEEFVEQLMRQMARMDSLLQSLSPEMRRELEAVIESVFDDPALQQTLAELAGTLESLSPRGRLGSRHGFFGDQEVSLEEAMGLMDRLQSMEELEGELRGALRGEPLSDQSLERLREMLGENAAKSLAGMRRLVEELEGRGLIERSPEGMQLTARGMRKIGQKALGDLFGRLRRDRFGEHDLMRLGHGGERGDDSKRYEFGDPFDLDVQATVMNALSREAEGGGGDDPGRGEARRGMPRAPGAGTGRVRQLDPRDFSVHRTETLTRCATVLMLDMSRSMPLRGYFYAAKKVALALDSLIRSQYPRDSLTVVGFSDLAREIPASGDLPALGQRVRVRDQPPARPDAGAPDPGPDPRREQAGDHRQRRRADRPHREWATGLLLSAPSRDLRQDAHRGSPLHAGEDRHQHLHARVEPPAGALRQPDDPAQSRPRLLHQPRSARRLRARRLRPLTASGRLSARARPT